MHRVELKVGRGLTSDSESSFVPNAPCGVESPTCLMLATNLISVPNAPCGVESSLFS